MLADMHIHTTASDGSWTPEELITHAGMAGIELVAVTDHDSIENINKTSLIAGKHNIRFINGVEVSSSLNGSLYHILGYGIDIEDVRLNNILKSNTKLMEKNDDESILALIEDGYDINFEEYVSYDYDRRKGGWKSLNFLIDKGLCSGVGDFFSKIFTNGHCPAFPVFPEPYEIISIIKKSGGIPVLAHPIYDKIDKPVEDILNLFRKMGIEGVECYHPNHTLKDIEDCLRWCRTNDMIITGGSDCHGDLIKTRKLGMLKLDTSMLKLGSLFDKII